MTAPAPYSQNRSRQDNRGQSSNTGAFAKAVREGIDNEFITWAAEYGRDIAKGNNGAVKITTSQIRNIYGTAKKLEMNSSLNMSEVLLLKPRVAYANKRNGLGDFFYVITNAIDAVNEGVTEEQKKERFQRFCKGFEAILAYHRANDGK